MKAELSCLAAQFTSLLKEVRRMVRWFELIALLTLIVAIVSLVLVLAK